MPLRTGWGLPDPVFEYTETRIVITLRKTPEVVRKEWQKTVEKTVEKAVEKAVEKIFELINADPRITQKEMMDKTGLTRRGVEWNLKKLKSEGRIERIGPDRGGHWKVK